MTWRGSGTSSAVAVAAWFIGLAVAFTGCVRAPIHDPHRHDRVKETDRLSLATTMRVEPSRLQYVETVRTVRLWFLRDQERQHIVGHLTTYGVRPIAYYALAVPEGCVFRPRPSEVPPGVAATTRLLQSQSRRVCFALWPSDGPDREIQQLEIASDRGMVKVEIRMSGGTLPYPQSVSIAFDPSTGGCMSIETDNWQGISAVHDGTGASG